MTEFNFLDYTTFVSDYSIKNGVLVDEFALNLSPQRIKKEVDNVYNVLNILNGNRLLSWSPIEEYLVGELCQNRTADDKYYRARKNNSNKRPDLFPEFWEVAKNTDYTLYGDFTNFLAKNNVEPYHPVGRYNPATKGYVDFQNTTKLDIDGKAVDSAHLNGEIVSNTLSNSLTKPASVNLVNIVNNRVNNKLDTSKFNDTNVLDMIKNVDGKGSGLDADLLDGLSSEFFMRVGKTTNFDTMLTPGSYLITPGGTGAPDKVETYSLIVIGSGNYKSQIATSLTNNKIYYRSYVGSWTSWKILADSSGNVATATKLMSPVTIALSGDVIGSASFDGSRNIDISSQVQNDSHTHDIRYYTKSTSDGRFLGIQKKAVDSTLFNGLNDSQFVRTDIDTLMKASYAISGTLNVSQGQVGGIHFQDIASNGSATNSTTASITLETQTSGVTELILAVTNKSTDIFQVKTLSNTGLKHNNYTVWTQGNDGASSGLNADLLDGYDSSVDAAPNTVVIRDKTGNINGLSSSVSNTNLVDMYSAKTNYPVGSLVQISTSSTFDIEENAGNVFGVIADKPGFILDDGIKGLPVTMVGKTPVIINGTINKGDKITASGGVAKKAGTNDKVIGIALDNKTATANALLKCFVQVQI